MENTVMIKSVIYWKMFYHRKQLLGANRKNCPSHWKNGLKSIFAVLYGATGREIPIVRVVRFIIAFAIIFPLLFRKYRLKRSRSEYADICCKELQALL